MREDFRIAVAAMADLMRQPPLLIVGEVLGAGFFVVAPMVALMLFGGAR